MDEKSTALAAVRKSLIKNFGSGIILRGDRAMPTRRVPTGSLSLDIAMGGGFPVGKVVAMWGEKSGGKTTTALRIAGIFQGLCRNCWRKARNVVAHEPTEEALEAGVDRWTATGECDCYGKGLCDHDFPEPPGKKTGESAAEYKERMEEWAEWKNGMMLNSYEETIVCVIDAEHAFDFEYFSNFGDPRRLLYVLPSNGEEAMDTASALTSSSVIDLMIFDSLAHFTPAKEVDASTTEWQQGLQARIVNKGIRVMITRSAAMARSGRRLSQIWINQKRQKIGVTYGSPDVKPSGMGQEFAAHIELKFRSAQKEMIGGKKKKDGAEEGGSNAVLSTETFFIDVVKNKTAAKRGTEAQYEQLAHGNDTHKAGTVIEGNFLMKLMMEHLVKKGDDGYDLLGQKFKTQSAMLEAVGSDPELYDVVYGALMRICGP